ncbi:MAG TPA: c-type cytochrome domain-containing protein, partial [Pirellulaceae bacterium]|nr:c-type cytochrome domain-containing protein [Pirellulaceae bacterium]
SVTFCSIFLLFGIVSSAGEIDFEKQVAPILVQNCLKCHNGTKSRAGLNLASRETALKGSDAGEVIVPGQPQQSLLLKRAEDGSMPPEADGRRLTAEEVEVLTAWVKGGAKWPDGLVLSAAELRAESSQAAPARIRRPRLLRIRRVHFHSRRDLASAEHRGPRTPRTRISGGSTRASAVEQTGK